jgi:hypothetical protein
MSDDILASRKQHRWIRFLISEFASPRTKAEICVDLDGKEVSAVLAAWLKALGCRRATLFSFPDRFNVGYEVRQHLHDIATVLGNGPRNANPSPAWCYDHIGRLDDDPHPEDPEAFTYLLVTAELDDEQLLVIQERWSLQVVWRIVMAGVTSYGRAYELRSIRL